MITGIGIVAGEIWHIQPKAIKRRPSQVNSIGSGILKERFTPAPCTVASQAWLNSGRVLRALISWTLNSAGRWTQSYHFCRCRVQESRRRRSRPRC